MEASKSNEVLHEMIRQMKDEQIPQLRREITNGLEEIRRNHKEFSEHLSGEIRSHHDRLTALENYKVGQEAQLGVWKWIISLVGISTLAQWLLELASRTK